jgi:DNA polymerase-1
VVAATPPDQTPITLDEVREARRRYFERYPGIQLMIEDQRAFGAEHKYVETMFGMRQPLNVTDQQPEEDEGEDDWADDDESAGKRRGSWWGNQAINGPIQGTAHQLLECALVNLYRQPENYKELKGRLCMDVHDALYFIVQCIDLKEAYKKARYLMEQESLNTVKSDFPNIDWKVPIVTEAEAGFTLGCQTELHEDTSIGEFLLHWTEKRRVQIEQLNKEISKMQEAA